MPLITGETLEGINLGWFKNEMIPKIIHYCLFGGNPLPPLARECIA